MENTLCHFWYSAQAASVSGIAYARIGGDTVPYTEMRRLPEGAEPEPFGLWDDARYLGAGQFAHTDSTTRSSNLFPTPRL